MPNQRSKKRKSTSVTIDRKLLEKLQEEAKKNNTNVSNLLEEIAREKYGIKKDEESK
jgi:post-segregation antitoxin (ccd killing protein)